jgi:hypothetical protein
MRSGQRDWRENLPFLSGKDAIIERIAGRHHELIKDPDILALRPHLDGPSWLELRAAGLRALGSVAQEIATAQTTAQAQTAELRREAYTCAFEQFESTMLTLAARFLVKGLAPDIERRKFAGYVGYGRRAVGGDLEPIPPAHWEAATTIDWTRWHLAVPDHCSWTGVRVLDFSDLQAIDEQAVTEDFFFSDADEVPAKLPENGHETARNVSHADLERFLSRHVGALAAGSPHLTEDALHAAARDHFSEKKVSRDQVRKWIQTKMPADKRFRRGKSPEF